MRVKTTFYSSVYLLLTINLVACGETQNGAVNSPDSTTINPLAVAAVPTVPAAEPSVEPVGEPAIAVGKSFFNHC